MSVVLITGCSSGFGLETALAFARRGDVVCASMRNLEKSTRLTERAAAEGLTVHLYELDVTDPASITAAVGKVVADHGPVDVLVNNAGVAYSGAVETFDMDRAMAAMDTNFWGAFRMIQAVVPSMRERRAGSIINVTSVAGRVPGSAYTAMYSASKHALGSLSESLHDEVGHLGVKVVCIEPGFYQTEIMANAAIDVPADAYAADRAWVEGFYALSVQSAGCPAEVADAIVAAATEPSTPVHVVVGEGGVAYVEMAKQTGTVEAFHAFATTMIESVVGPRPSVVG